MLFWGLGNTEYHQEQMLYRYKQMHMASSTHVQDLDVFFLTLLKTIKNTALNCHCYKKQRCPLGNRHLLTDSDLS